MKTWIPTALSLFAIQSLLIVYSRSTLAQPPMLEPVQIEDVTSGPEELDLASPATETDYFGQQNPAVPEPIEEIPADAPSDAPQPDEQVPDDEENEAASRARATLAHLQKLGRPIGSIRVSGGNRVDVPKNYAATLNGTEQETIVTGSGMPSQSERYTVNLMHRPLYYEEINLERCGEGHGIWQNARSGWLFFATTVTLPYRMVTNSPDCLDHSPGDCKSCQYFTTTMQSLCDFEFDRRAVLTEAAALAGFSFLLL